MIDNPFILIVIIIVLSVLFQLTLPHLPIKLRTPIVLQRSSPTTVHLITMPWIQPPLLCHLQLTLLHTTGYNRQKTSRMLPPGHDIHVSQHYPYHYTIYHTTDTDHCKLVCIHGGNCLITSIMHSNIKKNMQKQDHSTMLM